MSHAKESVTAAWFSRLFSSYFPGRQDNGKQITLKILFLVSLFLLLLFAGYFAQFFLNTQKQADIVDQSRSIWHAVYASSANSGKPDKAFVTMMLEANSDFKGWITVPGTLIDNPIYQTDNNVYYLTHNQNKKSASCGALFFDFQNQITQTKTDQNLVIYGRNIKSGAMFGTLSRLRSLQFYKQNPVITFSTLTHTGTYKIFAVLILNSVPEDDGGRCYDVTRNHFFSTDDFNSWLAEAYQRSLIDTGIDVQITDNLITLITNADDFNHARLAVMAREIRTTEPEHTDTSLAAANTAPRYPKRWYDDRGMEFPFS